LNARQDDEAWRLHGHPARRAEGGGRGVAQAPHPPVGFAAAWKYYL